MYIAIGEPLGCHIVEVVGGLHKVPNVVEIFGVERIDLLLQAVEFSESLVLEFVTEPSGDVPLLVCPRHRVEAVENACGLVGSGTLGYGCKLNLTGGEHCGGQSLHEAEDARSGLLVLAKGLVVHKEVDNLAVGVVVSNPTCILVGSQRPLAPTLVGEAEGDVIGEFVVTQQQAQLLVECVGIDEVGALPTQHVAGTLGQHSPETHCGHLLANGVGVDELGVAERGGGVAKLALHQCGVGLHLFLELFGRNERRERVGVGLGEEFHTARLGQLAEAVEHIGGVATELLNGKARDGEGYFETALVLSDEFQKEVVHWQVALGCHALHNGTVGTNIKVIVVFAHIEKPVCLEPQWLMNLKVQTNCFHIFLCVFLFLLNIVIIRWTVCELRNPLGIS